MRCCSLKKEYYSNSTQETESIAKELADGFTGGEIIAFKGGLGFGKTCFVKGLAKGLGFNGDVTSPTFAIVNEYRGGRLPLFHFDMYRITGWNDLYSTGYFEYMDENGVMAIEWSENIFAALPNNVITVTITQTGDNSRKIVIESEG